MKYHIREPWQPQAPHCGRQTYCGRYNLIAGIHDGVAYNLDTYATIPDNQVCKTCLTRARG